MTKNKLLLLLALLMTAATGAWADETTVTYALQVGDSFTSGQTVEVKNAANDVVATITYGESGGNAFSGAVADNQVTGFTASTAGNNVNGNQTGGTFYTITPKVDATISVAVILNAGKAFYILEDGTALTNYNGIKEDSKYYGTYEFEATANKAYKFYCAGSKLGFYGFTLTPAAAAAENETIIFNDLGLENAYDLTTASLNVGNIELNFDKADGSNSPAFYTTGGGTARIYKGNTMSIYAGGATITKIVFTYSADVTPTFSTGSYNATTKTWEGEAATLTLINAYTTNTQIRIKSMDVYYSVASAAGETGYSVTMKDGVKDAGKWTVKVGEGQAQALPIGGLKGDGTETVTLQYNGRLKVKGVKATSDAAPAAPAAVDLSKLTENTELKDGDVVTGTLGANVKISIADGATVTLDGVTIEGVNSDWYPFAALTCVGDATIILKEGSTNKLKGFQSGYPGIFVPEGKTLTIQGSGSLDASAEGAAGIGGGYAKHCGNITIEGGTITATGAYGAAGIGGGWKGNCGNITIKKTVTSVTATKGSGANSIGAGKEGSCGTVTIEEGANVTQN